MGAWIETIKVAQSNTYKKVAPRVGAWIETQDNELWTDTENVAPRVGAWIETVILTNPYNYKKKSNLA